MVININSVCMLFVRNIKDGKCSIAGPQDIYLPQLLHIFDHDLHNLHSTIHCSPINLFMALFVGIIIHKIQNVTQVTFTLSQKRH